MVNNNDPNLSVPDGMDIYDQLSSRLEDPNITYDQAYQLAQDIARQTKDNRLAFLSTQYDPDGLTWGDIVDNPKWRTLNRQDRLTVQRRYYENVFLPKLTGVSRAQVNNLTLQFQALTFPDICKSTDTRRSSMVPLSNRQQVEPAEGRPDQVFLPPLQGWPDQVNRAPLPGEGEDREGLVDPQTGELYTPVQRVLRRVMRLADVADAAFINSMMFGYLPIQEWYPEELPRAGDSAEDIASAVGQVAGFFTIPGMLIGKIGKAAEGGLRLWRGGVLTRSTVGRLAARAASSGIGFGAVEAAQNVHEQPPQEGVSVNGQGSENTGFEIAQPSAKVMRQVELRAKAFMGGLGTGAVFGILGAQRSGLPVCSLCLPIVEFHPHFVMIPFRYRFTIIYLEQGLGLVNLG